jgi:hypothetical protein
MADLKKFKTLLKQIKGVLNVWKDKGLTNQEKYFLDKALELSLNQYLQEGMKKLSICVLN